MVTFLSAQKFWFSFKLKTQQRRQGGTHTRIKWRLTKNFCSRFIIIQRKTDDSNVSSNVPLNNYKANQSCIQSSFPVDLVLFVFQLSDGFSGFSVISDGDDLIEGPRPEPSCNCDSGLGAIFTRVSGCIRLHEYSSLLLNLIAI